jgi:hypothetical protein
MSTNIPGNLAAADTPQFVFLTFDDAITSSNYRNYTNILNGRRNPNGCPITMTFYVHHQDNDYVFAHDLFYLGNEMASKSISNKLPSTVWAAMNVDDNIDEMDGMNQILARYANIPYDSIKGWRAPFLQTSGDNMLEALTLLGMTYDNSFTTKSNIDPPIWPYTLDFGFKQDCQTTPCPNPNSKFPGLWEVPMVVLNAVNGVNQCNMADACTPQPTDAASTFDYLKSNFDRFHTSSSKAPFGIYLHSAWFQSTDYRLTGYMNFLDYLHSMNDVYIVSISKAIEWMKNPTPLSMAGSSSALSCPSVTPSTCNPRNCYYMNDLGQDIFMRSCVSCPPNYPWVGNTLGD